MLSRLPSMMVNLQNSLQSIFADKLIQDDRDPVVVFSFRGDRYGVFSPNVAYWNQALVVRIPCIDYRYTLTAQNFDPNVIIFFRSC